MTDASPSATSPMISTPAVDRAGVHDDRVLRGALQALGVQTVKRRVLAQRREEAALHPLALDAEHHHDVRPLDRLVHAKGDATRRAARGPGAEASAGRTGRLRAPILVRSADVRARDAAVEDVPDDGDLESGEALLAASDREGVEKRLRRMLVGAVAGVHDRGRPVPREEVRRPGLGMPQHDEVGGHRLEVAERVEQRLALHEARRRRREVQRVGGEPLFRDLERRARAGRRLDEEIDDGLAAQRRDLLDLTRRDVGEPLGGVEDQRDLVRRTAARCRAGAGCRASRAVFSSRASSPALGLHDHDLVLAVGLRQAHVDALGRRPSGGSCRRSPRGPEARGGRGRRGRRAGSGAAGRGPSGRRARRGPCAR